MLSICILNVLTINASCGLSTPPSSSPHPVEHEWADIDGSLAVQWGHLKPAPDSILEFFLAATKNPNAPQITAVVQLLICHVRIYVVVPVVRATIAKNEMTLMRSSMMMMMMMILVNIKMEALMEKQMTSVIVVNINCMKI